MNLICLASVTLPHLSWPAVSLALPDHNPTLCCPGPHRGRQPYFASAECEEPQADAGAGSPERRGGHVDLDPVPDLDISAIRGRPISGAVIPEAVSNKH